MAGDANSLFCCAGNKTEHKKDVNAPNFLCSELRGKKDQADPNLKVLRIAADIRF